MNKTTVTAHSGSMGTPDNSEESIYAALDIEAEIIELDVNFLDDMTPVLSHNTPKGKNHVTLSKAFEIISPYNNVSLNLDMKHTFDLRAVETQAEKYFLQDRIFFTGIEEKDVEEVRKQCRFTKYYLNLDINRRANNDEYDSICEKIKELGAVGLNTYYKNITKECVDRFHFHGLLVSAWTVNRKTSMKKLLRMGVDNITTRRPDRLIALMNNAH